MDDDRNRIKKQCARSKNKLHQADTQEAQFALCRYTMKHRHPGCNVDCSETQDETSITHDVQYGPRRYLRCNWKHRDIHKEKIIFTADLKIYILTKF